MPEEQTVTITPEQYNQAVQIVSQACMWSDPPKSDSISPWARVEATRNALELILTIAKKAFEPTAAKPELELLPIPEASANGQSHDEPLAVD